MERFKRKSSLTSGKYLIFQGILFSFLFSCTTGIHIESEQIKLEDHLVSDRSILSFIAPYTAEMDQQMNVKIAESQNNFIVARPGSNLTNWIADAVFVNQTKTVRLIEPTFCLLNTGGIRSSIGKGDVKLKDLFKVMPFDNTIVWVKLPMHILDSIATYLVNSGGEPISNITMRDGKLLLKVPNQRQVNGFWVITSDYLFNGGDHMDFFRESIEVIGTQILIRDVLIEEAKYQKILVNDTLIRIE